MTVETQTTPDFVKWLQDLKKQLNAKTDGQLAEALNVRQDTLSLIITGRRGPSAQFVETILASQKIIYGTPEYVKLLTAAHKTNLEMSKRRRRPGSEDDE